MGQEKLILIVGLLLIAIVPVQGAEACEIDPVCTQFSTCKNGVEIRGCVDLNQCPSGKFPVQERPCATETPTTGPCVPNWDCTAEWSVCKDGNRHQRCVDLSQCGLEESKPNEVQSCGGSTNFSEVSIVLIVLLLLLVIGVLAGVSYLNHLKYDLREEERTFFIPDRYKK